jgi:UDP-N-acetylglucosamine 2-epimerase
VKKIVLIAQGRSGFLKVAPLFSALDRNARVEPVPVLVERAGQAGVGESLTAPFGTGGRLRRIPLAAGSAVGEVSALLIAFERLFTELAPAFVVSGGDDNAAVAAAVTASRMGIPVVSLDAGLRSYDRSETEELNRLLVDSVSALQFVSEHSGIYNLINEGYPDDRVLFAGNTSIDSLVELIGGANRSEVLASLGLEPKKFGTVLLDLPLRTETLENRDLLCRVLESIAATTTLLLPCDGLPGGAVLEAFGSVPGIRVRSVPEPLDLLRLLKESAFVLTDTGTFESELTVMNVPCLSLRPATFRPSTVEVGTNVMVGFDEEEILERTAAILSGKSSGKTLIPEKWDGAAALRIAEVLEQAG